MNRYFIFQISPVVLFLFLFETTGHAQLYMGLKGGFNHSNSGFLFNLEPEYVLEVSSIDAFYLGLPVHLSLGGSFELVVEPSLAEEGAILEVQTPEKNLFYTNTLIFARLSMLGKLSIWEKGDYSIAVSGGIVPGWTMGAVSSYTSLEDIRTTLKNPIVLSDAGVRQFDLALASGIILEKEIAKHLKITADLRIQQGIINISKDAYSSSTTGSWSLLLGIMIPLKKKSENEFRKEG